MAVEQLPDYRGLGDARLELGTGTLAKVDRADGKRNALVEVRVHGLQHPLKGWADTQDPSLRLDTPIGSAVDYRIVVRRRSTSDRAVPLGDLPNDRKLRELVGLIPAVGGAAPPPPVTDPDAGPQRAERPHSPDAHVNPSRLVASDARPWEPLNTDGRINLSSYEVLAAAGAIDHAATLLREHTGAAPAAEHVVTIAGSLLAMADSIQTAATGGRVDRMSSSHTRARGFLRTAIEIHPPAFAASREERLAWREQVTAYAVALFRGACDLVDRNR